MEKGDFVITHCLFLSKDTPECQPFPALPSLPSLKTCACWQSARCARTQEIGLVSASKADSHWLERRAGWQLGHRATLGRRREDLWCWYMCDISWLLSLSSHQSLQPQLCYHMLTGHVTQCPGGIFPGRESEYGTEPSYYYSRPTFDIVC